MQDQHNLTLPPTNQPVDMRDPLPIPAIENSSVKPNQLVSLFLYILVL